MCVCVCVCVMKSILNFPASLPMFLNISQVSFESGGLFLSSTTSHRQRRVGRGRGGGGGGGGGGGAEGPLLTWEPNCETAAVFSINGLHPTHKLRPGDRFQLQVTEG